MGNNTKLINILLLTQTTPHKYKTKKKCYFNLVYPKV